MHGTKGIADSVASNQRNLNQPLPRAERLPRRAKNDRGLPPDSELRQLAQIYLSTQRKLFPKLAAAKNIPEVSDAVLDAMVEDFKGRHRTAAIEPEALSAAKALGILLGGSYGRYSCDNSNPLSIADQLVKSLFKAHSEHRFIPWCYVFADYSVTGLDSSRQGYTSYKRVLSDSSQLIETTYVDDFTRPSRDELEWWKLAHLSRRLRKRMIGASDGFDLHSPDWDFKITIYGLLSRLHIKGLREKVLRGMRGGASRGECLGKPPLGMTRCDLLDPSGNVIGRANGSSKKTWCIDPRTRRWPYRVFYLFAIKRWSIGKIRKYFNTRRVDNSNGWTNRSIRNILTNCAYVGVVIWNRTRREFDRELEKTVTVLNPHSEWVIWINRRLAIITPDLWKKAQRRLAEVRRNHPLTGRKPSRNQVSPSTLFSGTLLCDSCGHELTLNRSAGKYKSFGCPNGRIHAHNCQLTSSKSTRMIEKSLLEYLCSVLLSEENVRRIASTANKLIQEELKKPRRDLKPLKHKEAAIQRKIRNLMATIADEDDDGLRRQYHAKIKSLKAEADQLRLEIQSAQGPLNGQLKPLLADQITEWLSDARSLLNHDTPAAAEALRSITGMIRVRQEPIQGRKRGARWIAMFSPGTVAFLAKYASKMNYPDSCTLEFLSARKWITAESVEVAIDVTPRYEEIAPKVAEMQAKGGSISTAAAALKVPWNIASDAAKFAKDGTRPSPRVRTKPKSRREPKKYLKVADEVTRLRDEEEMSFEDIARKLGISPGTVTRAYNHSHRDIVEAAAENGKRPNRGRKSGLGPAKHAQIVKLLRSGRTPSQTAKIVGCGTRTVYRVKRQNKEVGAELQRLSPTVAD